MKILIVEDEIKLANSIAEGLGHKGFAADIVSDGKIALNRIVNLKDTYDIIILDLMLPSLDGESICISVREKEIMTPILVLTAKAETETKVKLLSVGADDYLVKPFSFDELVARINALSRRPREISQTTLEFDDITLNSASHIVMQSKTPIPLTLKEFQILEYLMKHQNEVVSRETLLEHLWDSSYDAFSNVIDVHVKNLRKKLQRGKNKEFLETIRGMGYKLSK